MTTANRADVLAIGIDAAESTLVRQLIEQNEMPVLKSLLAEGQWLRVQSPAHIGSGAVWPTFMTGAEPTTHGVYSEWSWRPDSMSLSRYNGRHLTPFWTLPVLQNVRIGIFDVPFALPIGMSEGFEVSEWWAHDTTDAGLQAGPKEILSLVKKWPAHPLSANRFFNTTPNNQINLKELVAACVEGVRLRGGLARTLILETQPRLTLMVFPEIHHASHQMWHTMAPNHAVYNALKLNHGRPLKPLLKDVYRAVDEQIGALIEVAGSDATIMVFALHGMRPALGFPAFLAPLLCERGFSRLANWRSQSWTKRALSLLAATKRHTPDELKKLYYRLTPTVATHKLARPTMLPAYDWANTRAFSLPTDQYGWIRINLLGREAPGSVPLDQYDETCGELKDLLLGLDVVRTAANAESALSNPIPDLVVHWHDTAFAWPVRIRGSKVSVEPVGKKSTGQHASEGFCIYRGANAQDPGSVVAAKDLSRLITESL
jgi:predicted AlkP superfamily phosphohydrolase/phosphomutase